MNHLQYDRAAEDGLFGPFETESPAAEWEAGTIVGSGRVGALVYGTPAALVVPLSHERFFVPANPTPPAPVIASLLDDIRQAVLAGESGEAGELLQKAGDDAGFGGLVWTNPLGICATITVRPEHPTSAPLRRSIDLEHGETTVQTGQSGGGAVRLRVLAPRDGEAVWLAIEADRSTKVYVDLGLAPPGEAGKGFMGAPNSGNALERALTPGTNGRLEVRAETTEKERLSAITVIQGGHSWGLDESGTQLTSILDVPEEGRVVLKVGMAVSTGTPLEPSVSDAETEWTAVRGAQAASHGELVRRSVLCLGGDPSCSTTEETWRRARAGDPDFRRRVVEIAYLSGRANVISATGHLPPTLQGVWQGTWTPAWSADYTLNGNVLNGGMASLIPTGTPNLARSLLRLVLPHLKDYRDNARNIYGADGMLLPSRMSDNGRANHFSSLFPHVFWVGCGGWILRIAADLVSTTGARSIVDDELWALVTGVLEFAESATVVCNGQRHLVPGYSPENTPAGSASPITSDPTMDIAILRDAARCARFLGEARGDSSLDERWEDLVAQLPPYRIAADESLAEWIDHRWQESHPHRHASQLYPLWYEPDEAFVGDSDSARALRVAAANTVSRKIQWRSEDPTAPPGRMEMAFGLVQLGVAAASLGDAEAALRCVEWLAVDHWTPALTTTHDAGELFNLDASGGLPAVVAAMLLGSDQRSLTIFPALPEAWRRGGSISGLAARGGVVVESLEWNEQGASVWLRRRSSSGWMHPDDSLFLRAGSGFEFAGTASAETLVAVAEDPVMIRMTRTSKGL